jgi:hypothetical protein
MATPAPHPTRRQLDDLDALLQRMLALPVDPAEEPAPPDEPLAASQPAAAPLADEPAPPAGNMILSDPLPVVTPPAPPSGNMILSDPLPPPRRDDGVWMKDEPRPMASGSSFLLPPSPVPPAAPVPLPLLNPVPPAQRRAPVLPPPDRRLSPREALIASRPPEVFVLLRPILWLNRAFDGLAFALGAPGRWLRRPVGRTALGLIGLLLLAAAGALVLLDRFGWTW